MAWKDPYGGLQNPYFLELQQKNVAAGENCRQIFFDEFVEHGPKFLILQTVSCLDPSRRLQMAPGAAQKS